MLPLPKTSYLYLNGLYLPVKGTVFGAHVSESPGSLRTYKP